MWVVFVYKCETFSLNANSFTWGWVLWGGQCVCAPHCDEKPTRWWNECASIIGSVAKYSIVLICKMIKCSSVLILLFRPLSVCFILFIWRKWMWNPVKWKYYEFVLSILLVCKCILCGSCGVSFCVMAFWYAKYFAWKFKQMRCRTDNNSSNCRSRSIFT